jgi:hypothetical protein
MVIYSNVLLSSSVELDHIYTTMSDKEYPPVKQSTGQTEEEQARYMAHFSQEYR